ncbi:unnamed protein product, partial [Ascophyllum nodosum]
NNIYYLPCGDLCGEDVEIPTEEEPVLYTYLGCYQDETERIFSGNVLFRYQELTIEFCAGFCQGSAYFGTQYGQECWCGEATD